jgi:hypothetical protein
MWPAQYPIPPDMRCPSGWVLSVGGLPLPSVPVGSARGAAIYENFWSALTQEERNDL